ncbi:unnamed protein product [Ranitomeya imitator]|uniref:Uncharacterized protein n=1 Tax=Ranitomeya imitator TaxID=111125 RepID=A0ABN9LDJ9_9NEOB|nr:unnamed protein product [Ranitomeya imitator]
MREGPSMTSQSCDRDVITGPALIPTLGPEAAACTAHKRQDYNGPSELVTDAPRALRSEECIAVSRDDDVPVSRDRYVIILRDRNAWSGHQRVARSGKGQFWIRGADGRCEFYSKFRNQRIMENVFVKNSGRLRENAKEDCSEQTATKEEAIDALNEEFLQLVIESMDNQREFRALSVRTDSEPSVFNRIVEKRDLAGLLEIQRRHTAEKISAAERELLYLHPPDSSDFHTSDSNQDK